MNLQNLCPCTFHEDDLGQSVCRQCRGDIYACECPLVHSVKCPKFDPEEHNRVMQAMQDTFEDIFDNWDNGLDWYDRYEQNIYS